ncbi:broad-complex core protein isoforms 1/2/3/4/5-like isoform X2 [Macrobrachium rosenbergii]|uniref:broad-complex core protein isoforms 1/2/3/4/5-like isoform X2 n=1 Tax=Macrobrachium rosenbergii TaxID=79674 RepID=UPI0034D549CB
MGDQCFCLRWNNYQSSMVGVLRSLLEEGQFVDVTLACDGRRLKAHKLMLSACSNFFRQLLKENPSEHPIIFLRDVRFWELESIMDFIYNGQVNVMQEQLPGFIRTAEALQIKGLAAVNNNNNNLRINPYIGDHISRLQEMYVGGGIGGEVGGEAYQPPPLKRPRRPPPAHSLPPRSENSSTGMKCPPEEMTVKATTVTALNQSSTKSQGSSHDGPEGSGLEPISGVSTTGSSALSPATASGASPSTRAASPRVDWPSGENLSPLPLNYNKGGYPVCKVCGKVFKHQGSLVAHYQVHQLRTKCPVCRKVLSRHYHMKVHLLTVHKVPDAEIEGLLRSQNIV